MVQSLYYPPANGTSSYPLTIAAWERLGNPGWNWDNYLKYTMKTETYVSTLGITDQMEVAKICSCLR